MRAIEMNRAAIPAMSQPVTESRRATSARRKMRGTAFCSVAGVLARSASARNNASSLARSEGVRPARIKASIMARSMTDSVGPVFNTARITFRNDNRAPRPVKLIAICGPFDIDDPQPAITVMMPDED
jgi:hypothetical protein